MIHIIGENIIEQAQAFNDVRDALDFDCDVYLGAMWAIPLEVELKNEVVYNLEPLYDGCGVIDKFDYLDVLRDNIVIDYSEANVEYLKQKGIESFYMPYGYNDTLCRAETREKDIEVLFVGSSHFDRRQILFGMLSDQFDFVYCEGFYGADLDKLISRAEVHVNIHHTENQQLEVVRLNYLIANGCNVVSEKGCEEKENNKYKNCLRFSSYENFVDTCKEAIENPIDGAEEIKVYQHDCTKANEWAIKGKENILCRQ